LLKVPVTQCYHIVIASSDECETSADARRGVRPTSATIKFSDLESLLKALGATISEREGSRVRIELGAEQWRCHRPHPGKEARRYQVEEARELLERAGVKP
jgi:hypothetical protein